MKRSFLLSLGSNIGDKTGYLRQAITLLQEHGVEMIKHSSFYHTSPVDYTNQDAFINMASWVKWHGTPKQLLAVIHSVEQALGRKRLINKGPRTIDIDIIAAEQLSCNNPELQIPHPRATERKFVMIPLFELAETEEQSDFIKEILSWPTHFSEDQHIQKVEEVV